MSATLERECHAVCGVLAVALFALARGAAWGEPELHVVRPDGPARLNRAYRITCEVSWLGEPSDYAVLPAEIDSSSEASGLDWCTMTVTKSRAFVRDDSNVVSQTIEIVPNKTGEFATPEFLISYLGPEATLPAENTAHLTTLPNSSASPSLRVDPVTLRVRPDKTLVWISGGLGVSLIACVIAWGSVRRARRPLQDQAPGDGRGAEIQNAPHAARRHRLDGKYYEFYLELARAAKMMALDAADPGLLQGLEGRARDVGYTSARPTEDQMNGDYSDVERTFARHKEERLS